MRLCCVLMACAMLAAAAPPEGPAVMHERRERVSKNELGLVPLVGGNSDIGLAVGGVASYARLRRGDRPYRFRLEALGLVSFKKPAGAKIEAPYQDYYLQLDWPTLAEHRLRLTIRLGYNHFATLGYYGLGNAASRLASSEVGRRYYQTDAETPQARITLTGHLWNALYAITGFEGNYRRFRHPVDSKLVADRALLTGTGDHALLIVRHGLRWDTRDDDTAPHRGVLHDVTGRIALGRGAEEAFEFGGISALLRAFVPLYREALVLGGRVAGELLFGDPPFYSLAKLDEVAAIGGENAVRGVPMQRYHGRVKVMATLELRAEVLSFRLFDQRMNVGGVAFADAGRVWAELAPRPDLDGRGFGVKYGVGGGVRIRWGETFVLRADAAWSPDARPIALYFNVGHVF